MSDAAPQLNRAYVCVFDTDKPALAALVLSYLYVAGSYTPAFIFPRVSERKPEAWEDDQDIQRSLEINDVQEFATRVLNAVMQCGKECSLILCGLEENQESYLDFANDFNPIRIESESDVDLFLNGFADKTSTVCCREDDIFSGLTQALKNNAILKIDETASTIDVEARFGKGLVVIENSYPTTTVLAINYGSTIEAHVHIVDPLEISQSEIQDYIESWKNGDSSAFDELSAILFSRVNSLHTADYQYATFFTIGIPYSLLVRNIESSYVDLNARPDFFIFNCINYEHRRKVPSAIVFSPLEFGKDEETDYVVQELTNMNYHVTGLIGQHSTAGNLSMYIQEFPYELIHICSHGTGVRGQSITIDFKDELGVTHNLEYDEAFNFIVNENESLVEVVTMSFPRKLDGMIWKSKELKQRNYSKELYSTLSKAIKENKIKGTKKDAIRGTKAIKCRSGVYQAMFNSVAGFHTCPVIFNNTCWSWAEVADPFVLSGARAYIGTLWDIGNTFARKTSEDFYKNLSGKTVLSALFEAAAKFSAGTRDEGVYIMWGLHFSTLEVCSATGNSRMEIAARLMQSKRSWEEHLVSVRDPLTTENINRRVRWLTYILKHQFALEVLIMAFRKITSDGS